MVRHAVSVQRGNTPQQDPTPAPAVRVGKSHLKEPGLAVMRARIPQQAALHVSLALRALIPLQMHRIALIVLKGSIPTAVYHPASIAERILIPII